MAEDDQNFIAQFLTIGSGFLVNMVVGLVTTSVITRLVDTSSYGQFSIYSIYVNIGMFIFSLGFDQVLVRYFYQSDKFWFKRSLLFKCWRPPIIIIFSVGALTVVLQSSNLINSGFTLSYILLLWIGVFSQVVYRLSLMVVRLQYKSKIYALLTASYKLIFVGIAIPLILLLRSNYFQLLAIATILSTCIMFGVATLLDKKLWNPIHIKVQDCPITYKEMIKYGSPFILSLGFSAFYNAIDKVSINFLTNSSEVGIYASATSLVAVFGIVQSAINTLWAPKAMRHYMRDPDNKEFYRKSFQYVAVVMFTFGIHIILFKDVLAFLLGSAYREAAYMLPFLSFYPIMYTLSEVTVNGINFFKKSYIHIFIAIVPCILVIVGNLFLIPLVGIKGAAISTGLSYVLFFTMRTMISNLYYPVKYDLISLYTMIAVTTIYAFFNTFYSFSYFNIILYLGTFSVLIILYHKTIQEGYVILKASLKRGISKGIV